MSASRERYEWITLDVLQRYFVPCRCWALVARHLGPGEVVTVQTEGERNLLLREILNCYGAGVAVTQKRVDGQGILVGRGLRQCKGVTVAEHIKEFRGGSGSSGEGRGVNLLRTLAIKFGRKVPRGVDHVEGGFSGWRRGLPIIAKSCLRCRRRSLCWLCSCSCSVIIKCLHHPLSGFFTR